MKILLAIIKLLAMKILLAVMKGEVRLQLFRYYGGQDEHQQEAVLRHEVEGKSGEVCFFMKV